MIKIHKPPKKKPDWLKIKLTTTSNYNDMKKLMSSHNLNTVCEEARCPNIYECWDNRTATVMILVIPVQDLVDFVQLKQENL